MELSFGNMTMELHIFPTRGGNIQDQSCHVINEVERLATEPSHFRKLVSRAEEQRNQAARWGWFAYPMQRRRKRRKRKKSPNLMH